MISSLFGLSPDSGLEMSVAEFLELSCFDELVEIDLVNDRCRNLYHVADKYLVPITDGTYSDLYRYCAEHMVHPDDSHEHLALMEPETLMQRLKDSEMPGVLSAQFRYRLKDGGWRWTEQVVIGGEQHGLPEGVVRFYVFDVQIQKDRESGAEGSGYYRASVLRDDLTGLLEEKVFFAKAASIVEGLSEGLSGGFPDGGAGEAAAPAGADGDWCLIAVDVERFRLYNDWYGREAGDFLLAQLGARFARIEDERGGIAGYLGQDDFCLLAPFDEIGIERLFDDVCNVIAADGASIGFMPAFGVSVADGCTAILDLYDRALVAVRRSKESVRNRVQFFNHSLYEQDEAEYRLLADFHRGLKNGEFCFFLQPQCRASNGKIVGVECLARWCKPDGTMVPPAEFVPVLEKHGFITDLDCYLWEDACRHLRNWIAAGHDPVPMSVNISQVDIHLIDVASFLEELVDGYRIPHSLIKVEITESAYADETQEVENAVRALRERGFLVMMDDFGSGYSSLNMLRDLNVDVLKLDAIFLRLDEANLRKGVNIVESVVNMAKTMALPIVVEGVETKEQAEFVMGLGCRYVQGFGYYRPMPPEEFERLIEDGELVDRQGFISKPNDEFRIREFLDRNVYSDSMLNSILGAVALYSWHGDDIDVVRFNEQFYKAVGIPEFMDRLSAIQNYMPADDRERFFLLLERAMGNPLTGSSGILGFFKPDGSIVRFQVDFFFLEEKASGKLFYGSARDMTETTELRTQMRLLSLYTPKSIVFLNLHHGGSWRSHVVIHGAEKAMALAREDFEAELREGSFFGRMEGDAGKRLADFFADPAAMPEGVDFLFVLRNAAGNRVPMLVWSHYVEDVESGLSIIVAFREAAPAILD